MRKADDVYGSAKLLSRIVLNFQFLPAFVFLKYYDWFYVTKWLIYNWGSSLSNI